MSTNTRPFERRFTIVDGVPQVYLAGTEVHIPIIRSSIPYRGLTRTELVSVAYKALGGSGHAKVTDPVLLARVWSKLGADYEAYIGYKTEPTKETKMPEQTETVVSSRNTEQPKDINKVLRDLQDILGSGVDEATIARIVEQKIQEYITQPKVVVVGEREPVKIEGATHFKFDMLLRRLASGVHLFLTGSAGVGKSTLMSQCAKALGLQFRMLSAKPLPQDYEAFGYLNTSTGAKVLGVIEELYENGGVFGLDEVDTGHASLMTMLNSLLAQDEYDFPCAVNGVRKVPRHKDFKVMATGNTYGQGGSLRYVGANKMNGASLDRFAFVHIPVDEQLEKSICDQINPDHSAKVIPVVRKARANVEKYALDYLVTPRSAIDMVKFMSMGETLREAGDGRLYGRGLPGDQEAKLLEDITLGA